MSFRQPADITPAPSTSKEFDFTFPWNAAQEESSLPTQKQQARLQQLQAADTRAGWRDVIVSDARGVQARATGLSDGESRDSGDTAATPRDNTTLTHAMSDPLMHVLCLTKLYLSCLLFQASTLIHFIIMFTGISLFVSRYIFVYSVLRYCECIQLMCNI